MDPQLQLAPEELARGGYFPRRFFVDFLEFVKQHEHRIEIITYDDLCWEDDFDYSSGYHAEHIRWQEAHSPAQARPLVSGMRIATSG